MTWLASRESFDLDLRAEIVMLRVVPPPIVTKEAGVFLERFRDLVKASTLHSANGRIGDEEFVLMFIDQIAINFAREFRMVGGLRQLATCDGAFNLFEVIPWSKERKMNLSHCQQVKLAKSI